MKKTICFIILVPQSVDFMPTIELPKSESFLPKSIVALSNNCFIYSPARDKYLFKLSFYDLYGNKI